MLWTSKVVGQILTRQGVTYKRRPRPGAKAEADWITFQLLTCHCGQTMTAMDRRSPRVTCWRARHDPDHPRPFGIAEGKIIGAIRAEADLLRPSSLLEETGDGDQRRAIEAKRERVLDLFVNGLIDKAAGRDHRLMELDDEMELLRPRAWSRCLTGPTGTAGRHARSTPCCGRCSSGSN